MLFAAGAAESLIFGKIDSLADIWGNAFAILGSVLGLVFSGTIILTGLTPAFIVSTSFPLLSLSFRIDYLSAFFMFLVSLIALFSSIYAFSAYQ